jgi:mRNA interferase RelE/StbE
VTAAEPPRWRLVVSRRAGRELERLPARVASAVVALIGGPLLENPQRLGKPLHAPWDDCLAARRGDYRVIYRLDHEAGVLEVVTVGRRADVYRPN